MKEQVRNKNEILLNLFTNFFFFFLALASYGLGVRFEKWKLKFNFRNLIQNEKKDLIRQCENLKWIQVNESNLQLEEAKKIIIDLDQELFDKTDTITTHELNLLLAQEEKQGLSELVEQMGTSLEWYKNEYQNLTEMVADLDEKFGALQQEKTEVQMSLLEEKNNTSRLTKKLEEALTVAQKKEEENQTFRAFFEKFKTNYRQEKEDWQGKFNQLGESMKTKSDEISRLQSSLQSSQHQIEEFKIEQENLNAVIASLERLSNLQNQKMQELTKQLESTQQGMALNIEKIQQMANEAAEEQSESFRQTIAALNSEKDKLKSEVQNLRQGLKAAGEEKKIFEEKLEQAQVTNQKELESLHQKLQDSEFRIEQIKQKADHDHQEMQLKLVNLEDEIAQQLVEKEKLHLSIQNQQEMYEQKLKILKDEIDRLTAPPPAPAPPEALESQPKVLPGGKVIADNILKAKG